MRSPCGSLIGLDSGYKMNGKPTTCSIEYQATLLYTGTRRSHTTEGGNPVTILQLAMNNHRLVSVIILPSPVLVEYHSISYIVWFDCI